MTPPSLDTVEFNVGAATQEGRLHLPEVGGWYPAVVVIGQAGDDLDMPLTGFLTDLGYAALTFEAEDSRLAPTALAAADSLLMRPDIRADLIGLLGFREGAWVAALAAARVPETAFAVLLPGEAPPPDLARLANVHCPVLALPSDPATAAVLTASLAHNPEATIRRMPPADGTTTWLRTVLGGWLRQQAA